MAGFLKIEELYKYDTGSYDKEKDVHIYENGVKYFEGRSLDTLQMSDELRDAFGAVEVAVAMFGEPQPKNRLYLAPPFPSNRGLGSEVTIQLFRMSVILEEPPVFLWRISNKESCYCVLLYLDNFKIKYPIEAFKFDRENWNSTARGSTIKSEDELIGWLEELLYNV